MALLGAARHAEGMEDTRKVPGQRILIAAALVTVAVAVTALVVAERTPEYPAGSPEAAAQGYLQAAFDGDDVEALQHIAPELRNRCDDYELIPWWISSSDVARFSEVDLEGDHATIRVTLRRRDYEPPALVLEPGEARRAEIALEKRDGAWLITGLSNSSSRPSCPSEEVTR
jgi:hypothetical protein